MCDIVLRDSAWIGKRICTSLPPAVMLSLNPKSYSEDLMRLITGFFLLAAICISIGCNTAVAPTVNTANSNVKATTSNANTNPASNSAAPSKEVLAAREKQAFEAWKAKDGKFFEGALAPNFVMM